MRAANVAAPHPSRAPVRLLEAVAEEFAPPIAARMAAAPPGASLCVKLRCGALLLVGDSGQAVLAALLIQALNSALPC